MANNDLVITLTLNDKASQEVAKALKGIGKDSDDAANKVNKNNDDAEKGTKKHKDALLKARDAVKGFHKEMFVLAAVIGSVTFAVNEYANSNTQTRDSLRDLQASMKSTISLVGSIFAPVIVGLAEATKISFDFMRDAARNLQITFAAMVDGFVYGFTFWKNILKGVPAAMQEAEKASKALGEKMAQTFVQNIPSIEAAKNKLKDIADMVGSLNTRFLAGEIAATTFYEGINSKANNVLGTNLIIAEQLKQLHDNQLMQNNIALQDAVNKNQEYIALSKFQQEEHRTATQGMMTLTMQLGQSIQTNLSGAMTGLITGAMTAKQAFQQLGQQLLKTVVDFFVQKAVAMALDFALGKSLMATNIATGIAAGAALTAAYAPAALAANIASFGGAALAAASTFPVAATAEVGALLASKAGAFAVGTPNVPSDMMAKIHQGETIIPATFAESLRRGELSVSGPGGGGGGDIQINLYGVTINSKENVRELAEELGFEVDRKFRNARARV